jgi:hypothetical protein
MDAVGLALERVQVADRDLVARLAVTDLRRQGRRAMLDQVAQRLQLGEDLLVVQRRARRAQCRGAGGNAILRLTAVGHLFDAEGFLPHWHNRPLETSLDTFLASSGLTTGSCAGDAIGTPPINHEGSAFTRKKL